VAEQGRDVSDDGPRFDRHFLDHVPGFRHSRGVTFEERLWYVRGSRSHLAEPPVAVDTLAFHRSWPEYAVTPLVDAPGLAPALGVRRVLLKDESRRLGLPAFKALGITWAVGRVLGDGSPLPGLQQMRDVAARRHLGLVTATHGNHGRALARVAALLGVLARVFVPDECPEQARRAIAAEGAQVVLVPGSYDRAVAEAASSVAGGEVLVQDTAWPGYEDVPRWVVEGYATMLREVEEQLHDQGVGVADLVTVPVGVGSLAQAVVAHVRSGRTARAVLAVEPAAAPCVTGSLLAGRATSVETKPTIMNALNCGTPSGLAWPVLRDGLDAAVTVTDAEAERAATELADAGVDAGPSGAAALAGVRAALTGRGAEQRRRAVRLPPDSTVVLLVTEARQAVTSEEPHDRSQ
jgi:diaminopropionate ammonia-lyase